MTTDVTILVDAHLRVWEAVLLAAATVVVTLAALAWYAERRGLKRGTPPKRSPL